MKFESKFSLNQKVYQIGYHKKQKAVKCEACNGVGKIPMLNGKDTICPECYGRCTNEVYDEQKWLVIDMPMKIGKCRAEITSMSKIGMFDNIGEYNPEKIESSYQYMCYDTGIVSGTLYYEKNLFANIEEAQLERDRRNSLNIKP
jgi:hypothetical protein